MNAAIYCRVSSAEQSNGISLQMQQSRCSDYAGSRGWQVAETYQDIETGRHARRPQLIDLRRRLDQFDAVIVWRIDRAARSIRDLTLLLDECAEADTAFVSVTEAIDVGEPFGRATASILGTVAELESDNIGARVSAAKAKIIEGGVAPWAPKFGYRRDPETRRMVSELTEAAVLQRLFSERAAGATQRSIAEGLNRDGLTRRGTQWNQRLITMALHDTTYIGKHRRGVKVKRGREWVRAERQKWIMDDQLYPSLITERVWYLVHKAGLQGRRSHGPVLFRGVVVCARCGSRLHMRRRTDGGRVDAPYICSGRRAGSGCAQPQILEPRLLSVLKTQLAVCGRESGPCCFVEPMPKEEAERGVRDATAQRERIEVAYKRGLLGIDDLDEADRGLRQAIAQASLSQATFAETEVSLAGAREIKRAVDLFYAGEVTEANALLRATVARIEVDSTHLTVRIVLCARVGTEA